MSLQLNDPLKMVHRSTELDSVCVIYKRKADTVSWSPSIKGMCGAFPRN